jgi:hypothetical protein
MRANREQCISRILPSVGSTLNSLKSGVDDRAGDFSHTEDLLA